MSSNGHRFSEPLHADKPPETGGLLFKIAADRRYGPPSEPFAPAVVAVAAHAAVHPAVPPAFAAKTPATGEKCQAPLLALVLCLVERIGGIGDLLQRGRSGSHIVRALTQPRQRILLL